MSSAICGFCGSLGTTLKTIWGIFSICFSICICGFAAAVTHILLNAGSNSADGRGERGDLGSDGRVFAALSAGQGADAGGADRLHFFLVAAGVVVSWLLVRAATSERSANCGSDRPGNRRRRGVGARGRICRGTNSGQSSFRGGRDGRGMQAGKAVGVGFRLRSGHSVAAILSSQQPDQWHETCQREACQQRKTLRTSLSI